MEESSIFPIVELRWRAKIDNNQSEAYEVSA